MKSESWLEKVLANENKIKNTLVKIKIIIDLLKANIIIFATGRIWPDDAIWRQQFESGLWQVASTLDHTTPDGHQLLERENVNGKQFVSRKSNLSRKSRSCWAITHIIWPVSLWMGRGSHVLFSHGLFCTSVDERAVTCYSMVAFDFIDFFFFIIDSLDFHGH